MYKEAIFFHKYVGIPVVILMALIFFLTGCGSDHTSYSTPPPVEETTPEIVEPVIDIIEPDEEIPEPELETIVENYEITRYDSKKKFRVYYIKVTNDTIYLTVETYNGKHMTTEKIMADRNQE